jgi:hypothetical protein
LPAGLPANDRNNWCPNNGANGTCYFWNETTATYAVQKSACQRMGGYLVSYNTAMEQRLVDAVFAANNYWLGIEPLRNTSVFGTNWVLADGQFLGNMTPSNSNPYRHW